MIIYTGQFIHVAALFIIPHTYYDKNDFVFYLKHVFHLPQVIFYLEHFDTYSASHATFFQRYLHFRVSVCDNDSNL